MIITDVWSLHYNNFLIQIDGTKEEAVLFHKMLEEMFDDKTFLITVKGGSLK